MTDTRKDPRAPVALKVRFKSKSVDEFAEQFSQDVSRGGLFIKSKDPMPIGTMLKFELQLSDETKIIAGVGRVVWRRDTMESAGDDAPAGMGIKFIKMDGDSRSLVDRLVDERAASQPQSVARFESGSNPASAKSSTFFPAGPSAPMPAPEDRTQVRHARELLSAAFQEGGAVEAHARTELKAKETRERIARLSETAREKSVGPMALRGRKSSFPPTANALRDLDHEAIEPRGEGRLQSGFASWREGAIAPSGKNLEQDQRSLVDALADLPDLPGDPISEDSEEPTVIHARRDPTLGYTDKTRDPSKFGSTPPRPQRKAFESRVPTEMGLALTGSENSAEPLALRVENAHSPAAKTEAPSTPPLVAPIGGRFSIPAAAPQRTTNVAPKASSKTGPILFAGALFVVAGVLGWWITKHRSVENSAATPVRETAMVAPPTHVEETPPIPEPTAPVAPTPLPTAGVDISSTPTGAEIRVNGIVRGTTPLTLSLPIGVASEVALSSEGFVRVVQTITATAEHAPVAVVLEPLPWIIAVTTNPPGAQVRVGGKTGVTPARIEPPHTTRPMPWSVLISRTGYLPARVIVAPEAYIPGAEARVAAVDVVLVAARERPENAGDARHEPGWVRGQPEEPREDPTPVASPPEPEPVAAPEPAVVNRVTDNF